VTITLKPETEQRINDELKSGRFKDADEVMQRALRALKQQEAAAHIRELRKGVTLGGLKMKDLIHEGHKY
jgi:putative addiction module CopG family antidote